MWHYFVYHNQRYFGITIKTMTITRYYHIVLVPGKRKKAKLTVRTIIKIKRNININLELLSKLVNSCQQFRVAVLTQTTTLSSNWLVRRCWVQY